MVNEIFKGNELELLKTVKKGSVNTIITDISAMEILDCKSFIEDAMSTLSSDGKLVVLSKGMQSAELMCYGKEYWKYNLIWQNTSTVSLFYEPEEPVVTHVDILVFAKGNPKFNYQNELKLVDAVKMLNDIRRSLGKDDYECNEEERSIKYTRSVLSFPYTLEDKFYDNQSKPNALYDYLIKTFSDEEEIILDPFMNKAEILSRVVYLKRNYIGFESDDFNFRFANNSIRKAEIATDRLTSLDYYPMYKAT